MNPRFITNPLNDDTVSELSISEANSTFNIEIKIKPISNTLHHSRVLYGMYSCEEKEQHVKVSHVKNTDVINLSGNIVNALIVLDRYLVSNELIAAIHANEKAKDMLDRCEKAYELLEAAAEAEREAERKAVIDAEIEAEEKAAADAKIAVSAKNLSAPSGFSSALKEVSEKYKTREFTVVDSKITDLKHK